MRGCGRGGKNQHDCDYGSLALVFGAVLSFVMNWEDGMGIFGKGEWDGDSAKKI